MATRPSQTPKPQAKSIPCGERQKDQEKDTLSYICIEARGFKTKIKNPTMVGTMVYLGASLGKQSESQGVLGQPGTLRKTDKTNEHKAQNYIK